MKRCLRAGRSRSTMAQMNEVPACVDCGCCCFSRTPDYLRVMGIDYERLGADAARLTEFRGNRAFMKMTEGHCIALTYESESGQFLCSIYERRPDVCHWLERGSGQCRAERAEKVERPLQLRRKGSSPRGA